MKRYTINEKNYSDFCDLMRKMFGPRTRVIDMLNHSKYIDVITLNQNEYDLWEYNEPTKSFGRRYIIAEPVTIGAISESGSLPEGTSPLIARWVGAHI